MINKDFHWFIGVVVTDPATDPSKAGYVQVRNIFEQSATENATDISGKKTIVPDKDLPWARVMMPITSASTNGIGVSPIGLKKGTQVLCFYQDSPNKNLPIVLGALPNIESISDIAKGVGPVSKQFLEPTEPKSPYAAQYGYNQTITTTRGHVIELDDTPKAERIHIYHRNGSYIEMDPDGNIITRAQGESREIVGKKKIIFTAEGNISIIADTGDIIINADGNINLQSTRGTVNIRAAVIGINA